MTAISKNVYFNISDDIVNKYNKTGDRTIKMKPIDVTSDSYAEYNLKLVTVSKYQHAERLLLRDTPKIGPKKLLLLVKW